MYIVDASQSPPVISIARQRGFAVPALSRRQRIERARAEPAPECDIISRRRRRSSSPRREIPRGNVRSARRMFAR